MIRLSVPILCLVASSAIAAPPAPTESTLASSDPSPASTAQSLPLPVPGSNAAALPEATAPQDEQGGNTDDSLFEDDPV